LTKGDKIFISGKKTPGQFTIAEELQMEHKVVNKATRGELVALKVPFRVRINDKIYLWREKKSQ